MLHSFSCTNYLSFRQRVDVSLRMTDKAASTGWDTISESGQRLATAMAVVGANGAGKTSVLKPLAFLCWFISGSFQTPVNSKIPIKPHFTAPEEPSEFEVEADDEDGVLWRYVLRATSQRVLHEALYQKPARKNAGFSYVFVRDWDPTTSEYVIRQKSFGFLPSEARKVRENASLISTAAQYGVEVAQRLAAINISTNLSVSGRIQTDLFGEMATRFFMEKEDLRTGMESLLSSWDLGLSGIEIREHPMELPPGSIPGDVKPPVRLIPYGIHEVNGERYELPMSEESNGTRTAFINLGRFLSILSTGGIAVIDELESDMHPHMLEPLLDLFANPRTNPNKAQILFTCHSAEVLHLLGKSQVLLVEKTRCESTAWRLDSMSGVRSQDNLYAKYMSGAYGAVPNL
jgi:uncharacterized protein